MAAYAARARLKSIVFIPRGQIAYGKLSQALEYGALTLQIDGDFDKAMDIVQQVCDQQNIYLLNSVNSEYAFGAQIPDRERLREYDMGAGAGAWINLDLVSRELAVVGLGYRLAWVHTLNGSNLNGGDTNHLVQTLHARGALPLFGGWGIGADGVAWLRNSYFSQVGLLDIDQRVGRLRLYGWFRTF